MKGLFAGLAATVLVAASPAGQVDDLAWMAGEWSREEGERWTEESWAAPRGGMMIGYNRSGRGEGVREFEFLRIAAGVDGIPAYIAQPGGRAPVMFRLVQHDAASATFENGAHDYPQRIHYRRDGDTMTAMISAIDGSRPMRWTYRRR